MQHLIDFSEPRWRREMVALMWWWVHRTAHSHHDSLCPCVTLITFKLCPVLDYPLHHLNTFLPSPVLLALLHTADIQHVSCALSAFVYTSVSRVMMWVLWRLGLCHFILIFSAPNRVPEYVFAQLNQILIKLVAWEKSLKKSILCWHDRILNQRKKSISDL